MGTTNNLCKLADTDGGEAIGTEPEETPHVGGKGIETCTLAKSFVVRLELARVVIFEIAGKESRLPHEKCFNAYRTVRPTGKEGLGCGLSKEFERKGIDFASEIVGKENVGALFPVAMRGREETTDVVALLFYTLKKETLEGSMDVMRREGGKFVGTGDGGRCGRIDEGSIVIPDRLGNVVFDLESWEGVSILEGDRRVIFVNDMEHNIVEGSV